MYINNDAVSFAAFSLAKILASEPLRAGVLDRRGFAAAILAEIDRQRTLETTRNEDGATLLSVYLDEIDAVAADGAPPMSQQE